ncbi:MAG: hypothetical protein H0T73_05885 [Ardenticatenales bacterium]|nr:hypothetical protein [Ardenticatenales bacterium]
MDERTSRDVPTDHLLRYLMGLARREGYSVRLVLHLEYGVIVEGDVLDPDRYASGIAAMFSKQANTLNNLTKALSKNPKSKDTARFIEEVASQDHEEFVHLSHARLSFPGGETTVPFWRGHVNTVLSFAFVGESTEEMLNLG